MFKSEEGERNSGFLFVAWRVKKFRSHSCTARDVYPSCTVSLSVYVLVDGDVDAAYRSTTAGLSKFIAQMSDARARERERERERAIKECHHHQCR